MAGVEEELAKHPGITLSAQLPGLGRRKATGLGPGWSRRLVAVTKNNVDSPDIAKYLEKQSR